MDLYEEINENYKAIYGYNISLSNFEREKKLMIKHGDNYVSVLELCKNPFKYIYILSSNIFTTDTPYREDIYYRFNGDEYHNKNVLCLKHEIIDRPYNDFYYESIGCSIITGLYLPENFSFIYFNIIPNGCFIDTTKTFLIKNPYSTVLNNTIFSWENVSLKNVTEDAIEDTLAKVEKNSIEFLLEKQTEKHLEKLLSLSRELNGKIDMGRGKCHTYALPEIYMNGKRYIRIEPFKPYFLSMFSNVVNIISYKPIDLYIEFLYNSRTDTDNMNLKDIPLSDINPDKELCINDDICQEVKLSYNLESQDDMINDMVKSLRIVENRKNLIRV